MLKTLLIDDEANCLKMLEWELKNHCPEVQIIGMCETGKDALKSIKDKKPDLVFLDIDMPYINGFELLELLPEVNFDIIFTTAHDEYAVRAFKTSAVGYLLKPVDGEEIKVIIDNILERNTSIDSTEHLEILKENLAEARNNQPIKNIALPTYEGYVFVRAEDIIFCQSDNNYTKIFFNHGKQMLISRTLKEVGEMLDEERFFRVHNSFIVNLNEISNYVKADGGYLIMSDGNRVKVSRTKKEELFKRF